MAERLHFAGDVMPYASMLAAEHLSRYALVKSLCIGRRVLDIACGEGYGSALMLEWGAKEVCGLDISPHAIANGRRMFSKVGVRFLEADASVCGSLLEELGAFDLIVSFETLEHVADVKGMLEGFRHLSTAGGAIVISCPNDAAVLTTGPNHFHVRTYTFDEFREAVTAVLGQASSWSTGTSVLGFGAFSLDSELLNKPPAGILGLMSSSESDACSVLPAQIGHEVVNSNCAYYVAGWNCTLPQTSVIAPISFQAYEAPWNNWVRAQDQVEQLNGMLEDACSRHAQDVKQLRIAGELAAAHWQRKHEDLVEEARTVQANLGQKLASASRLNEETIRRAQDFEAAHTQSLMALKCLREEAMERVQDAERRVSETQSSLARLEGSRWHRTGKLYYRLYQVPVLGQMLRASRRLGGALSRL